MGVDDNEFSVGSIVVLMNANAHVLTLSVLNLVQSAARPATHHLAIAVVIIVMATAFCISKDTFLCV